MTGRWRHYKGGLYDVLAVGRSEADGAPVVIYRDVKGGEPWVRPLTEWSQDVGGEPRYVKIAEVIGADHAKRLAEIEADHAREEQIVALGCEPSARHVERGWLLAEHRAASDALAAAGIRDDGRDLAERVTALAHDASYGASYRESWERLRRSKDADDIARAQATRDLDIMRRAAIATAVSLGEVLPEDAGPETIAAGLRRGVGRAKPAAPEERCSTCGEPYTVPPTRRAVMCSNGFHLCRGCTRSGGRRTKRCARHATPEMERAEILAASVAPAADDDEPAVGDMPPDPSR